MTKFSNLPCDLIEEIFSRVPMTYLSAIRSTCKNWNALSNNLILGKAKQVRGFMVINSKVCSIRYDHQAILNNNDRRDFFNIKKTSILHQLDAYRVSHCDGLILCATSDDRKLMVWNPYLRETRWIQTVYGSDRFSDMYALGYDKKRNHKILCYVDYFCKVARHSYPYRIYDFSSDSWTTLNVTRDWNLQFGQHGVSVSLKGNTYFLTQKRRGEQRRRGTKMECYLLCFDFTAEVFGPRLSLPFQSNDAVSVTLSCVREEQLAVLLYQRSVPSMKIWITNKIDTNEVSWSKFLDVDILPLMRFPLHFKAGNVFIDEEKKVAVLFDLYAFSSKCGYRRAHIFGENGYFKSVDIKESRRIGNSQPFVFFSYFPSLVKLQIKQRHKRKERY